ncbi:MAG: flagellar export chaperone FlgN [Planctomycetota bacterium]
MTSNTHEHTLQLNPGAAEPTLGLLANQLNESMAGLQKLLRQLLDMAQEKLTAIRGADAQTLQRCTADEAALLEQILDGQEQRRAILARTAQCLRVSPASGRSLEQMADHLAEPHSSALRARNAALRQIALELQEKNKLVAQVAHNLQSHIRGVFAELARANQESIVYGPEGQHEQRNARSWLDAVG